MGRLRTYVIGIVSLAMTFGMGAVGGAARAAVGGSNGSIRLLEAQSEITVSRPPHSSIFVTPGVYVASVGGAFDLRVQRADYDHPVTVTQVIYSGGGTQYRPLPADILDGWMGLAKFLHVTVTDSSGAVILKNLDTFCPNSFGPQRVTGGGPDQPTYPYSCSFDPFTLGSAWGIDQGWAADPFGSYGGLIFRGPDGHYTMTFAVDDRYVKLFHIPASDATAAVGLTVTTCHTSCSSRPGGSAAPRPAPSVPTIASPPPATLPDLVALPAWNIGTSSELGHDYVNFGATAWIGGTSPLDVEGFRRPGTMVMNAYQYFYRDGQVVGRARAGNFVYDARPTHQHWHFTQFAAYSLLDKTKTFIVRSHKQGFCIAPTDGIDLLLPDAVWRPDQFQFNPCGDQSSIWVRETLPVGWGDTYYQSVAGQAFDITGVPNGRYYIEVAVNPRGLLYESDTTNDVTLREVILKGTAGARTVEVPPWHGINSEGCPPSCCPPNCA